VTPNDPTTTTRATEERALTLAESLRPAACAASAARRESYAAIVPASVAWLRAVETGGDEAEALAALAQALRGAGL
jgi:hypothetical protein